MGILICSTTLIVLCYSSGTRHERDHVRLWEQVFQAQKQQKTKPITIGYAEVISAWQTGEGTRYRILKGSQRFRAFIPSSSEWKIGDTVSIKGTVLPSGQINVHEQYVHLDYQFKKQLSFVALIMWVFLLMVFFQWNEKHNWFEVREWLIS